MSHSVSFRSFNFIFIHSNDSFFFKQWFSFLISGKGVRILSIQRDIYLKSLENAQKSFYRPLILGWIRIRNNMKSRIPNLTKSIRMHWTDLTKLLQKNVSESLETKILKYLVKKVEKFDSLKFLWVGANKLWRDVRSSSATVPLLVSSGFW